MKANIFYFSKVLSKKKKKKGTDTRKWHYVVCLMRGVFYVLSTYI